MRSPPDTRRGAPTTDRRPSKKSPRPRNLDTRENRDFRQNAQGLVRLGVVTDHITAKVGLRAIAYNLDRGNFRDADGIRRSLGLSWEEVVGVDHALASEAA